MDTALAKKRYHSQRNGAKKRGIEWRLTFREWLDWWGEDLDRRGSGRDQLQMQRKLDSGPYALGNIVKGVPRQNVRTWQTVRRNVRAAAAKSAHEAALDAAPTREADESDFAFEDEPISSFMSRDVMDNPKRVFG